jgi:hypothetical protein
MEIGVVGAVTDLVQDPVREAPKLEVVHVTARPQPMAVIDVPVHQRAARLATPITVQVSISIYDPLCCFSQTSTVTCRFITFSITVPTFQNIIYYDKSSTLFTSPVDMLQVIEDTFLMRE